MSSALSTPGPETAARDLHAGVTLAGVPCTCAALRRISRLVSAIYDRHLAEVGLTTNQYSLMKTLAVGPVPLGRLARRAATDRTTLTRNLEPLRRAGWVAISAGADARQRVASLTDAGNATLQAAWPAWVAAQSRIEAELGVETVRTLHETIAGAMTRLRPLLPAN